jgi:carboxyl-terminal processing protease
MPKKPALDKEEITEKLQPITPKQEKQKTVLLNFFVQFAVVAIIFFAIGFTLGQKQIDISKSGLVPKINVSGQTAPAAQNVDFSLFWQVFETLPKTYFEKSDVNGQKMLYGAISGMVRSLGDPYTAFLDPKQNEAMRSEIAGKYEGVGIQIGFNNDKRLVVIAPLKGTPAEREGILAQDLILKIDDKDTFDITLPEAVELIRGQAGTRVKLTLLREGEEKPLEKNVERASIDVKSVEVEFKQVKGGEIAIVSVSRFGEKTDAEWDKAVDEIEAKRVKGIVVDMRNNPGGLLSSSIHLGSEFLRGTIVKEEFADGSIKSLASDHEGRLMKVSMVVLVNGGSASAAEIFAGAIKDNKRGRIVGEKTFGKGSVQDVVDLPGGSGLHITIAKWLTPKGNSIHKVGISPDVTVDLTAEDRNAKRDPQLEKAIEIL